MQLRSLTAALTLSVALTAQNPRSTPAAPGGAAMPQTAQQQVEMLVRATRNGDAVAFWDWLPAGYQQDVEQLARSLADRVDGKTYDRTAKLLHRFAAVALEKQQFVFGNQTVAAMLQHNGADVRGAKDAYAALFRMLQQVAGGELGSVDGLRRFDGRAFMGKSGKALLETVFAFARATGDDPVAGLDQVSVRTLGQKGGEVRIELKGKDRAAEVTTFVQVEGRWVPVEMAQKWQDGVGELREKIAAMPKQGDAKLAAQAGLVLGMIEGVVKQLEDVESQQDFDEVVGELMQMARPGGAAPRQR